jgi:hypothetical protein
LTEAGARRPDLGRILWILGTVVLGVAVFSSSEQIMVLSSWAKADGQVTGSEIVRHFSPKSNPVYRVRVTFEYKLDGLPHIAVSSSSLGSSELATVSRKVARYPVGSHHAIYYDPANPTNMRFDAGYNVDYLAKGLIIATAGLLFVIAGTVVRFLARRSQASALR